MVDAFRAHRIGHILLSLLPSTFAPSLGLFDAQSERSESLWRMQLKVDIATYLRDSVQASLFLDLDQVMMEIGQRAFFR